VKTADWAQNRNWIPITESDDALATVRTAGGTLPYAAWCESEVRRVREAGRRAEVCQSADGRQLSVWAEPA
jgi:hypothetical protein